MPLVAIRVRPMWRSRGPKGNHFSSLWHHPALISRPFGRLQIRKEGWRREATDWGGTRRALITVRLCSYSVVKERGGEKGNPSIIGAMVRVFDEDSEFSLWSEDGKPLE